MFKKCNVCDTTWPEIKDFIDDKEVIYAGYNASIKDPLRGLFLFNHRHKDCGTTLAVSVSVFGDFFTTMIEDGILLKEMTTSKNCPQYCLEKDNIEICTVTDCKGYWIRKTIQFLREKK